MATGASGATGLEAQIVNKLLSHISVMDQTMVDINTEITHLEDYIDSPTGLNGVTGGTGLYLYIDSYCDYLVKRNNKTADRRELLSDRYNNMYTLSCPEEQTVIDEICGFNDQRLETSILYVRQLPINIKQDFVNIYLGINADDLVTKKSFIISFHQIMKHQYNF